MSEVARPSRPMIVAIERAVKSGLRWLSGSIGSNQTNSWPKVSGSTKVSS